jgi:hypothetical protein
VVRKSPCAAEYFLPVNPSSFVPNLFLFCFLSFLPVHQNHKLNVYSEMNKNGNPNSVELLREREREGIIFRSLILQKASLAMPARSFGFGNDSNCSHPFRIRISRDE